MNIALASHRARTRVEHLVGHALPWLCGWRGTRGPKAGCTALTDAEWATVQAVAHQRGWAGITACHWCTDLAAAQQQIALLPHKEVTP
jgi:hypothetical protein